MQKCAQRRLQLIFKISLILFVTWRPIENTAPITFLLQYFFASISSIASLLASSGTFALKLAFLTFISHDLKSKK